MLKLLRAALLALLALLALATPVTLSHALTLPWVGGEDVSCQLIGTITTSTSSTFYRSGYARLALGMTFTSVTDPPANRCLLPNFGNQTSVFIHAENYQASLASTSANMNAIEIYGSDGLVRLAVSGTGTAGQVVLRKRSGAGAYTNLATCTSGAWPAISLHAIDLGIVYSASGEFYLAVDGTKACDFVGDVTTDGITAVNDVDFACTNINSATCYWSEFGVATTDLRGLSVMSCYGIANGNAWGWSGGVANVNETTINDANGAATSASGQIAEWTCPSLPSGSFTYPAVCVAPRLAVGAAGPQHDAPMVRPATGSTDYLAANLAPTTSFANYQNCWQANPATSAGWTAGDFGTGFNLGIESAP
jgi:hypothetical protein